MLAVSKNYNPLINNNPFSLIDKIILVLHLHSQHSVCRIVIFQKVQRDFSCNPHRKLTLFWVTILPNQKCLQIISSFVLHDNKEFFFLLNHSKLYLL